MTSAICTLSEGDHSIGVAALANSLLAAGFEGVLFVGFRGASPGWANARTSESQKALLHITAKFTLEFIELNTEIHLTNYKPDFMLRLMEREAADAPTLLYLDPDITVNAPWHFFAKWSECGIALCEDVNSPLTENHPRRIAWRHYFSKSGFSLRHCQHEYVNGGCVGVSRESLSFLETWKALQLAMAEEIGGLASSKLGGGTSAQMRDPHFHFNASDQDALNATIEAVPHIPVSILGKEAMAFQSGSPVLPHALGTPKPWQKGYLREAIAGRPPTRADKEFWRHMDGPIEPLANSLVRRRRQALHIAALIGRFYRRF